MSVGPDQMLLSHRFHVYFEAQLPGVAPKAGSKLSKLAPLSRIPVGYSPLDVRFQSVSGLGRDLDVKSLHQGGENVGDIYLPQHVSNKPLVLERGILSKLPSTVMSGLFESGLGYFLNGYADIQVALMDSAGQPACLWYVRDAMPTSWSLGKLEAASNNVLIETMTFSYRWIKQVPVRL
jgi:phage tail-like protein